jgi:fructan beta-fructosidase
MVSVQRGGPLKRSGTQYFVGSFDGRAFTNDNAPAVTLWLDYGADNYAGVTWSNIPPEDGRRLFVGWMKGANRGPTSPWRGAHTVVRELQLRTVGGEIRLIQNPVRELSQLRRTPSEWHDQIVAPGSNLLAGLSGKQYEIVAEFSLDTVQANQFGFRLRTGHGPGIVIAYDVGCSTLTLDRGPAGPATISAQSEPEKPSLDRAMLTYVGDRLKMQILVDWSSVEVIANGGQVAVTDCIFPDEDSIGLELYATGGEVRLSSLAFYALNSATPR